MKLPHYSRSHIANKYKGVTSQGQGVKLRRMRDTT